MNINLVDLANKKVKGSEGMTVSDNRIDLSKFTGSELILTGKYTKGLLLVLRPQIQVTFKDAVIDNAGTNVTVKLDGVYDQVKVLGINAKLFGKAGNAASQMIYFNGTWSNIEVGGFDIDHRRDGRTGTTTTGACVQFAGVLKAGHNLRKVYQHNIIVRNAGDEGFYTNHFDRGDGYAQGDELIVEDCEVWGSGRDFFQQWGFRDVTYRRCKGDKGALEADAERNHISALSMNGDTDTLLVDDCEFSNVPQLIYSGSGTKIKGLLTSVKYTQGNSPGTRSNQAAYLKGPGEYTFKNCVIDAPNTLLCAITADGCKVIVEGDNQITAKQLARIFNGGSVAQTPAIKRYPVQAEVLESTINGSTTRKLLFEGKEFIL